MSADSSRSLAVIRMFKGLDDKARRTLEDKCRWRWVKTGERIVEQGSETSEVFFVVEGSVNIVNTAISGREVAFANLPAGEFFGELSAIDGEPRSATAVAAEPSLVAFMPSTLFLKVLQERVEVTFELLLRLARMVRAGDVRIMELSTLAATQRVYAELLRMAQPDAAVPSLWVVRPLPPLREIAGRVSTTRETVARAMSQLYSNGLLRRKGRNLYLMDRAKLEDFVGQTKSAKSS